ncbi:hypothetical protein [Streptomyces niveus]|uniref:hypothetical protein n=1 Tax=Streptomyces niveus TaxID=193462 RepID=UPI00344E3629
MDQRFEFPWRGAWFASGGAAQASAPIRTVMSSVASRWATPRPIPLLTAMEYYDCDTEARTDTSAIGVCDRCGLLTCQDHSFVVPAGILVANGLGRTLSPLPARRVVRRTCRAAETAR